MPRVVFSNTEPSEKEYFEEYNKYNTLNPWFILIFILRCFSPLCLALQVGIFEYPESVELYMREFSIPLNSSELLITWDCPIARKNEKDERIEFEGFYDHNLEKCNQEDVMLQMSLFKSFGYCVGALIGGALSDLYGRRTICLYFSIFWCVLSWSLVYVKNSILLQIIYTLIVSCCTAVNVVSYVTFGEIANKSNRFLITYTLLSYVAGDGFLYFALQVLVWRHLLVFISLATSSMIFVCWYIPESPRWLLNKDRRKEAYDQLNEISGLIYDIEVNPNLTEVNPKMKTVLYGMFSYLFHHKALLERSVILCISVTISSVYYSSAKLKAVLHYVHNNELRLLTSAAEAMGFLFFIPIHIILGKRIGLLVIYGLFLTKSLILLFVYDKYEEMYYSVFGILFGVAALNINWLYFLDFFPTFLRATAAGVGFFLFGTATAGCTFYISQYPNPFNYYIFLITLTVLGVVVFFLPDVGHQELPNNKIW